MQQTYLLAIDQGTTNSRAIIFNQHLETIMQHELPLQQSYPNPGWVEQDAEEMVENTLRCCRETLARAGISAHEIAAIGISNQRETTIIWDKQTGKPIYPAIVWQDRRTSDICKSLSQQDFAKSLSEKTGLLLDPYFSATKIIWILEHVKDARNRAERSELLFGTVDTYLLWKLTDGKVHATDITNASRTLLFNIEQQCWDESLLAAFNIPACLLPAVMDNAADFGKTTLLGEAQIPICGMAGDQQAATIGQSCFKSGEAKVTFGTGGFLVLNTGSQIIHSRHRMLSTIAYRIKGEIAYALEGSFFAAGVTIKWLRDTLKIVKTAAETELMAEMLDYNGGVYLVPAFTGLGAPYWNPEAHASISGLRRNSGPEQFARAALESVAYQTRDLLDAMAADFSSNILSLHVDGGMAANNWLLQFLADMLNIKITRPACIETSALGAACLAGLQMGLFKSLDDIKRHSKVGRVFSPKMSDEEREKNYFGWQHAVKKVLLP